MQSILLGYALLDSGRCNVCHVPTALLDVPAKLQPSLWFDRRAQWWWAAAQPGHSLAGLWDHFYNGSRVSGCDHRPNGLIGEADEETHLPHHAA